MVAGVRKALPEEATTRAATATFPWDISLSNSAANKFSAAPKSIGIRGPDETREEFVAGIATEIGELKGPEGRHCGITASVGSRSGPH